MFERSELSASLMREMQRLNDRLSSPPGASPSEPIAADERALVIVADDQADLREALEDLFNSVGIDMLSFENAEQLLGAALPDRPGCFILDVRMPGVSGLDLHSELARIGHRRPVIFLTAHGDVPMSIRAIKAGAFEFKTKPVREQELLDTVGAAIDADRLRRAADRVAQRCISKFETLSSRERQVLHFIVNGLLNKQMAYELGVMEVTIKLHRGNLMKKMGAQSVADLVRMWDQLPAAMRQDLPG